MKKKLTENARRHVGETLTIRWGTSRGRDSYGYTTCSLRNHRGQRVAACNGGGYDMRGTVVGNWIAATFPKELCALKESEMPENSHWQPERARVCDGLCKKTNEDAFLASVISEGETKRPELPKLPEDCYECPTCKGPTRQSREGKRIDDGRSFYGLRFFDPNYDPGKAVIGQDCSDRTLTKGDVGSKGKTVEEAEAAGNSFGLERLQAAYKATAPHATDRHTIPSIDGACGISCVLKILNAIGLCLRQVHDSSKLDVYTIEEVKP